MVNIFSEWTWMCYKIAMFDLHWLYIKIIYYMLQCSTTHAHWWFWCMSADMFVCCANFQWHLSACLKSFLANFTDEWMNRRDFHYETSRLSIDLLCGHAINLMILVALENFFYLQISSWGFCSALGLL